jgi:hypothetical protein
MQTVNIHQSTVNDFLFIFFCSFFFCQDKDTQVRLEMKHRKEEDDLYRKFARQREEEEFKFKEEFRVSVLPLASPAVGCWQEIWN